MIFGKRAGGLSCGADLRLFLSAVVSEEVEEAEEEGGEEGGEESVEDESEGGVGAVGVAEFHGGVGAYGVGGGSEGEALGLGAADVEELHDLDAGDAAEYAYADYDGCGEGGDAADGAGDFHGDGCGDGFGGEGEDDGAGGSEGAGDEYDGEYADDTSGELGEEDGEELAFDGFELEVEWYAERDDGGSEPEFDVLACLPVGVVVDAEGGEDEYEGGDGDEDGVEEEDAGAALEVAGEEVDGEGEGEQKDGVGQICHFDVIFSVS